jgi:outer membrane protein OmpA-like peptidoglycan-associated protein
MPLASAVSGVVSHSTYRSRRHVALYGIYFDTDKTDIKPESAATLKEIAALLKQDPKR